MVLDKKLLDKEKLDLDEISRHQTRLSSPNTNLHFKILKTMSLENGGIVNLEALTLPHSDMKYAAFIPSAGAASRYYALIKNLLLAIENGDKASLEKELQNIDSEQFKGFAVPEKTKNLILEKDADKILSERDLIVSEISAPKALQPAFCSGMTFMEVKKREHEAFKNITKEFYIVNPKARDLFSEFEDSCEDTFILEQGPKLSTIRFNRDGSPYVDGDGSYTVVPAGHGSLTKLIPEVKSLAPECDSILIKNIDNVNGISKEVVSETEKFMDFHSYILASVRKIRTFLEEDKLADANQVASQMMDTLKIACVDLEGISQNNLSLWMV